MTVDLLDQEKSLYERIWTLLRDDQLLRVFKAHGVEVFRRSSVLEGFDAFIKAHEFCGDTCLEIGTLKGLTAVVLARYFRRVISIDIFDDPLKWQILAELGIDNVEYINIRDNAHKAAVIAEFDFDAAFVDGDHARDTYSDFELVRRCGRVLMHEHWEAQQDVMRLMAAMREGQVRAGGKWALWTR